MIASTVHDYGDYEYFMTTFCGVDGRSRGKLISRGDFDKVLREGYKASEGYWSLGRGRGLDDFIIKPDLTSLRPLPGTDSRTAWVSCNIVDGMLPSDICVRTHLINLIARTKPYEIEAGLEVEFSLGVGRPQKKRGVNPEQLELRHRSEFIPFLDRLPSLLEKAGIRGVKLHSEADPNQYEISWRHTCPLSAADEHVFVRYMIDQLAQRLGVSASFMPLRAPDYLGNGCHVHVSFLDQPGMESPDLDSYAMLLSKQAPELSGFSLPTVNSMKRMHAWFKQRHALGENSHAVLVSNETRGELIRKTSHGTIEYRIFDGSTNPYIIQSVLLAPLSVYKDRPNMDAGSPERPLPRLPKFSSESLIRLSQSSLAESIYNKKFLDKFVRWRLEELDDFYACVSDWEISRHERQFGLE